MKTALFVLFALFAVATANATMDAPDASDVTGAVAPAADEKAAADIPAAPAAPAAAGATLTIPDAGNAPTILQQAVVKDGKSYFPATVIDPNARYAGLPFARLPVRVVSHVYGSSARRSILPPIPVLKPRFHRRALKRVRKSLRLLDRAYDALEAHLSELRGMRKQVSRKLRALQNEQLKHGYVVMPAPPVGGSEAVVPPQVQALMRSYLLNALENQNGVPVNPADASVGAAPLPATAFAETDSHVFPHEIVSLIEEAQHAEEMQEEEQQQQEQEQELGAEQEQAAPEGGESFVETEAEMEMDAEAGSEVESESEMHTGTEAEAEAEAEGEFELEQQQEQELQQEQEQEQQQQEQEEGQFEQVEQAQEASL